MRGPNVHVKSDFEPVVPVTEKADRKIAWAQDSEASLGNISRLHLFWEKQKGWRISVVAKQTPRGGPLPGTAPHPKEMKEMCASDIPVSSERLYRDIAFLFYIDPLHSIFTWIT